jgi:hypothetical protein
MQSAQLVQRLADDRVGNGRWEQHQKGVTKSKQKFSAGLNNLLIKSALLQLFDGAHEGLKVSFEARQGTEMSGREYLGQRQTPKVLIRLREDHPVGRMGAGGEPVIAAATHQFI